MNILEDVRMHGAGNRFLIHFGTAPISELLGNLDDADGLLVVKHDERGVQMRIFNADGKEAEQCGNGLRCVALHLVRSRCIHSNEVVINTVGGSCPCLVHEDRNEVEVTLCIPQQGTAACMVDEDALFTSPELIFVNVGNPNAVLWTEDDPLDVRDKLGDALSCDPAFTQGMNVHVARRDDEQYATVASWERGVGPTLASGTGGAAVFVTAMASGPFYVSSHGGTLSYQFNDNGAIVKTGPAGYV